MAIPLCHFQITNHKIIETQTLSQISQQITSLMQVTLFLVTGLQMTANPFRLGCISFIVSIMC
jgi:NhaP-type Na+/H+ and K+/H+ antiporter